jgi:hypothetical protein
VSRGLRLHESILKHLNCFVLPAKSLQCQCQIVPRNRGIGPGLDGGLKKGHRTRVVACTRMQIAQSQIGKRVAWPFLQSLKARAKGRSVGAHHHVRLALHRLDIKEDGVGHLRADGARQTLQSAVKCARVNHFPAGGQHLRRRFRFARCCLTGAEWQKSNDE